MKRITIYFVLAFVNVLCTVAYVCTPDNKHCAGLLTELRDFISGDNVALESYHLIPNDAEAVDCRHFPTILKCTCKNGAAVIPFESKSLIEIGPINRGNIPLTIRPGCDIPFEIRITKPTLDDDDDIDSSRNSYVLRGPACGLFVVREGNIALQDMTINNTDCMKVLDTKYECWHRVESAPIFATGLRTLSNVHLTNINFVTSDIDGEQWNVPPLLVYFASSSAFEQLNLKNVSVSDVAHVSVKFDKCTGNVNVSERKHEQGTVVIEHFPSYGSVPLDIQTTIDRILDLSQWLGPTLLYRIYISSDENNGTSNNNEWAIYAFAILLIILTVIATIELFRCLNIFHSGSHIKELTDPAKLKAVDMIKRHRTRVNMHQPRRDSQKSKNGLPFLITSSDDDDDDESNNLLFHQSDHFLNKHRKK